MAEATSRYFDIIVSKIQNINHRILAQYSLANINTYTWIVGSLTTAT